MSTPESRNRLSAPSAFVGDPMVIHIGYPRTGSSFLQQLVFNKYSDCTMVQFERDAVAASEWPDYRRLVLTNESYAGWIDGDMPEEAAILKRKFPQAEILMVLRSQYQMFRSYYFLFVKGGGKLSFEQYVEEFSGNVLNYLALYKAYTDAFGNDRVSVFLYEDLVSDMPGTVQRILRATGLSTDFADAMNNASVKASAKDEVLALMQFYNRIRPLFPGTETQEHGRRANPVDLPSIGAAAKMLRPILPKIDISTVAPLICKTYGIDNDTLFEAIGLPSGTAGYPSAIDGTDP